MEYKEDGWWRQNLSVMKRMLFIMMICFLPYAMNAQDDKTVAAESEARDDFQPEMITTISSPTTAEAVDMDMYERTLNKDVEIDNNIESGISPAIQDTLHIPLLNRYGQTAIGMYPMNWDGWYDWELHKGLNVNIGISAFATFGKKSWRGTGFGQSISVMYAEPITDKLSIAVGGYLDNLYWSHDSYRDAGINAVIGYKFDEHWEGYIYGQKSLVKSRMPMPFYDISNIGDRIGAAIKYNFSPSFSIQLSVENSTR
ncbi:MAG: hypothetical protein LUC91_06620 [Prevotella sp.]|nr:hypothetical protein [Prevotella sp.]